jgi:CubicO group peptidase (beta-lactamase class C family)
LTNRSLSALWGWLEDAGRHPTERDCGTARPLVVFPSVALSGYVERKDMPGLVALVSRHDDVHVETLGTMSIGRQAPMKRDTIFHIASITKPITAVAAMILMEECKLRLDDSIEPWLPELANRRVLKSISASSWGLGMAVDIGRNEIYHTPGRFGWTGGLGTTAYTDPAETLIGILFTQRMMDSPEPPKVFTDFWTLAYGATE